MSSGRKVVYIVEDDPSFRKSVERLIKTTGFEAVSSESASAFLKHPHIRRPACLLLDVQLPDMDGLCLQQKLIEKRCRLPVIFMTGHGNIPMSVHAMKNGAIDFLPKPFEAKDLRSAVLKAVETDEKALEAEAREVKITSLLDTLTPREKEVFRWVITGKLNKQIASEMGVAEKTVKVHRGRVMQKMKVSSLAELVRLAEMARIPPAVYPPPLLKFSFSLMALFILFRPHG